MNINVRETFDKVFAACKQAGAEYLIVRDLTNVRYLTGCSFHAVGDGVVVVRPSGMLLFTDARYTSEVKKSLQGSPLIHVVEWKHRLEWAKILIDLIPPGKELIFERSSESMSFNAVEELKTAGNDHNVTLRPVDDLMLLLRIVKTPGELDTLREAHLIADKAFSNTLPMIRPGITEQAIRDKLNAQLRALSGEDELSFATIVASGPNGANAHATATDRVVEGGDLVTIDWGCTFRGYHSDTTRTIMVGNPSPKLQEIFDIVLNAQERAEQLARPGMTGNDLDKVARDIIAKAGYGEQFIHTTGHGVGMNVHEKPNITFRDPGKNVLASGMVFSIEPGIYIDGLGGVRIENTVILTDNGVEALSKLPKRITV